MTPYLRIGDPRAAAIPANSQTADCASCRHPIWISPDAVAHEAPPICTVCYAAVKA